MAADRSSMADFELLSRLGAGSFGVVFKARRIVDQLVYVIKSVRISELSFKEQGDAINEVKILAQMNSPHVVHYYDSFIDGDSLHIVMEFCNRGDLQNLLKKAKAKDMACLKEHVTWNIVLQIILGLQYLHSKKILHRDLKSANVFLMKDDSQQYFLVKIGDLGVAKLLETSTAFAQTIVGTPYYLSPELCADQPYRDKSDCWALGVLLYECCTLRHPFEARNQCALIMKIIQANFEPPSSAISSELAQLVSWLLRKDPTDRPNMKDILCEDFIRERLTEHRLDVPEALADLPATHFITSPQENESVDETEVTVAPLPAPAKQPSEIESKADEKVHDAGKRGKSQSKPQQQLQQQQALQTRGLTSSSSRSSLARQSSGQQQPQPGSTAASVVSGVGMGVGLAAGHQQGGRQRGESSRSSRSSGGTTQMTSAGFGTRVVATRADRERERDSDRDGPGSPAPPALYIGNPPPPKRKPTPQPPVGGSGSGVGRVAPVNGNRVRGPAGNRRVLSDKALVRHQVKPVGASAGEKAAVVTDEEEEEFVEYHESIADEEAQDKAAVQALEQALLSESLIATIVTGRGGDLMEQSPPADYAADAKLSEEDLALRERLGLGGSLRRGSKSGVMLDSKGGTADYAGGGGDGDGDDAAKGSAFLTGVENDTKLSSHAADAKLLDEKGGFSGGHMDMKYGAADDAGSVDEYGADPFEDDVDEENTGEVEYRHISDQLSDTSEYGGKNGDDRPDEHPTDEDDQAEFLGQMEQQDLEKNIEDLEELVIEARAKASSVLGPELFIQIYELCSRHMARQDAVSSAADGDESPEAEFIKDLEQALNERDDIEAACSVVFSVKVLLALENELNILLDERKRRKN